MENLDNNKNTNKLKLEIDSRLENIATVRVAVSSFISTIPITVDELMDIKTAVSEAVTNSVQHGYESKEGIVYITAIIESGDDNTVIISVQDFGIGIENIELAMTASYTSKPELEHAGLGFTIMETFMDEVIIDSTLNSGTTITMKKAIKKKKSI
ncbi:MAG: anti-sigma F factor [Clostridia bacterium]|nr:anti-sigma F factor [Clostridia bacterium]